MTLIKKDIYAGLVREKFDGKVKILQLADDMGNLEGMGQGEKITFPKWSLIGDPNEMAKGDQISTEELQQTEQSVLIKQVGKGVRCYDSSNKTSIGNQLEEGASQTSIVMARKLDADLIEVAKTTPFQATCSSPNAITSGEIESALLNYGDERDIDEFSGIVVNSLLIPSFYAMPEFTDAQNTTTVSGNGLIRNGLLGYYRGIPVFVTDKGTYDSTNNECITFVIKKRSLGYKFAKDLDIELEREASYKRTNIYADMMYAVALVKDDGVVVIKSTNV
ncbi:hypothetical protein [Senegalia massiliensis]|uniref:N4-gp56 family major capsid protein n=1 Tax=Senegalia massiliensis TaxID=1720316 RepID=A0A845QXV5_9CLOT|nr:hypothetical protein [Senegalia massiliensis]NBI06629.1 hypothetical protein [Senegalia massiliensis]